VPGREREWNYLSAILNGNLFLVSLLAERDVALFPTAPRDSKVALQLSMNEWKYINNYNASGPGQQKVPLRVRQTVITIIVPLFSYLLCRLQHNCAREDQFLNTIIFALYRRSSSMSNAVFLLFWTVRNV